MTKKIVLKQKRHSLSKKKPLYVFLHIPKCGGTTLKFHLEQNFERKELLFLYNLRFPHLIEKRKIGNFIENLTKDEKNSLKVVYGHEVYYGIHKVFPDRDVRYVLFLRNPISRIISHYNFLKGKAVYDSWEKEIDIHDKKLMGTEGIKKKLGFIQNDKTEMLTGGKIISFEEWIKIAGKSKNYVTKFLSGHLLDRKFDKKSVDDIKVILDRFYFVGIVENQDNFFYILKDLGIKRYFGRKNPSVQYFKLTSEGTKKLLDLKNKSDLDIFEYGVGLNKKFIKNNVDFSKKVNEMELEYSNQCAKLSFKMRIFCSLVYEKIRKFFYRVKIRRFKND